MTAIQVYSSLTFANQVMRIIHTPSTWFHESETEITIYWLHDSISILWYCFIDDFLCRHIRFCLRSLDSVSFMLSQILGRIFACSINFELIFVSLPYLRIFMIEFSCSSKNVIDSIGCPAIRHFRVIEKHYTASPGNCCGFSESTSRGPRFKPFSEVGCVLNTTSFIC